MLSPTELFNLQGALWNQVQEFVAMSSILNVIVICTPGVNRAAPLIETLTSDPRVRLHKLVAVMNDDPDYVAHSGSSGACSAEVIYGRKLLPREKGCSRSHYNARNMVSDFTFGGVILEDDARIEDINLFVNQALAFLMASESQDCLLSFYSGDYERFLASSHRNHNLIRMFGQPAFAVAYALTKKAALELNFASERGEFLADWPTNRKTKFLLSGLELVKHGDTKSISTIDVTNRGRVRPELKFRISVISGLHFLLNRSEFRTLKFYFETMIWPRGSHYLNLIRLKYYSKF